MLRVLSLQSQHNRNNGTSLRSAVVGEPHMGSTAVMLSLIF